MRIQPRDLRDKKRVNLWEVVPLPAPLVMWIDPSNLCNIRCVFCPTGDKTLRKQRPNGIMEFSTFCQIVSDLQEFPKKVRRINLYKDGEPLVNLRFADMTKYLVDSGVTDQVWSKTNGLLLNPILNKAIVRSGLKLLGISVNAVTEEGYRKVCNTKICYDMFRDNIADLYSIRGNMKISIKIGDTGLTQEELDKFYADFEDRCDYISVEGLHGWSNSSIKDFRLGTDNSFDGNPIVDKIACPIAMCALSVNWNGDVTPCNEDWMHYNLLGNIKDEHLLDIWHGKKLFEFRKMHLENNRWNNKACGECHYSSVLPDNIDGHLEEILEKLENDRR